jgi:hypothetical protein
MIQTKLGTHAKKGDKVDEVDKEKKKRSVKKQNYSSLLSDDDDDLDSSEARAEYEAPSTALAYTGPRNVYNKTPHVLGEERGYAQQWETIQAAIAKQHAYALLPELFLLFIVLLMLLLLFIITFRYYYFLSFSIFSHSCSLLCDFYLSFFSRG